MRLVALERALALRLLIVLAAVLATLSSFATVPPASAQGTATVEITNIDAGTGLPAPFTRFQVTSENGTIYGPLETDLNGFVAFSVTVDPQGTSFTVIEETPSACATAPEPQTTEPLLAGDLASLSFATQDNPGCGLGTIALYSMACPDGFSGPADDYGPWRDNCTGANDGTGFTISSVATGESWNPVAGAYGTPGRAPVVGLPAGDYTIQQNGDAPASVFCLVYDTANYATSPEPSSIVPVTLTNGLGTVSLSGNRLSCDVFTVPGGAIPLEPTLEPTVESVEPAAGATLEVHLAECPAGYVPTESIYDDCHGNGIEGTPVQLSSSNGFNGTLATTLPASPGPGVASFADLGAGTYAIGANLPSDASFLTYCSDDAFVEVPSLFDEINRTLSLELSAGQIVTCDWYVIPAQVEPPVGTSFLEMHALGCPAGTDPTGALYDICHGNGVASVTFNATGPSGYTGQAATTVPVSPGPGIATFGELSDGEYTISQEGVDPSIELVVYCSLADADDVVPFTYLDSDTISLELPAETAVVCDWYAIPPPDAYTTLQVTKYGCPIGMDANGSTTLEQFQQVCTTLTDDVDFTLAPLGQQGSTRATGSSGAGTVLFESLPTGNYSLTEEIPGDFNTPWAFCGLEGGELTPFTWIRGGDPLAIDATAGTYVCLWFNIPADVGQPSNVSVTKYLCPPGTTGDYQSRCASNPLANATFVLDGPGSFEADALTGSDGSAWFGELSPGAYSLTEIPPAGTNVAVYVVACSAGGADVAFEYNDATGMRIDFELPSGTEVDCAWYNIPPGTPTVTPGENTGSIVVRKFLCQGKSINQYNWDQDCVAESAPIGFSLATATGQPIAVGATNSDGVLTFTNLANGAYNLDETTGDWCHAEADRVDSAGNVLVQNGAENSVYIYNCSLQNVDDLPSTGTGETGVVARADLDRNQLWQLLFAAIATLGIALLVRHGLHQAAIQSDRASHELPHAILGDDPLE
jgi:hypothetical protein